MIAAQQVGKKAAQQQAQKMAAQQAKKMAQQQAKKMAQNQAKKQAQKQVQKKIQNQVKEKVQEKVEEKVREKIHEEVEKKAMKQINQFMAEEEEADMTDTSQVKEKPKKKKQQKRYHPKLKHLIPGVEAIDNTKATFKQLEVDLDRVQELLEEKRREDQDPKFKKANKKKKKREQRKMKKKLRQGRGGMVDIRAVLELDDLEDQVAEDWFQKEKQKELEGSEAGDDEDDEIVVIEEIDETGGTKKKKKKKNTTPLRSALFSLIERVGNFHEYLGTFLPCFQSGTYANKITKSVMGFSVGVVLVCFFYVLFVFALKQDPSNAAFTMGIIGPVICFGMAFSRQFSCLMLLMIPQLFSGKGRTILMAYVFLLVISGPLENLTHNIDVAGQSQVCGSELAMNQSNQVFQLATAPMAPFLDGFRSMIGKLNSILNRVKVGFDVMADATRAVGNVIQTIYDWIAGMVSKCNYLMGRPAEKCRKHLNIVAARCRKSLGIFQFLCGIVDLVRNVCIFADVLRLLCIFPEMIAIAVRKIGDAIDAAFDKIKDMLYVKFVITHDLTLDHNFSTTVQQIRENIRGEVDDRLKTFLLVLKWLNRILSFTFLLLLFRAYVYHRKYLTKDKHDNWYITEHFEEVDRRRVEMGKSALLPLNRKESWMFIKPDSIRLAKPERRRFILSITLWITEVGYATIVIIADYAAYWFLDMVRLHSEVNVMANAPGAVTVQVEGQGILADIYRSLVESLDPKYLHDFKFDTTKCLPHPTPPDTDLVYMIGAMFVICLLMVIFEAYGLRLRRFIMSKHYPYREQVRAVWLYNHILRRRGGYKKFFSRHKRYDAQSDGGDDVNFFSQLASRSKIWAKLLKLVGFKWKFCSNCGVPGNASNMDGFMHCENVRCPGVYCLQCVSTINNLCHLCSQPVDYTLCTDNFEFERESSEDNSAEDDEEKRLLDVIDGPDVLDYAYQYNARLDQDDTDDEDEETGGESSDQEDDDDEEKRLLDVSDGPDVLDYAYRYNARLDQDDTDDEDEETGGESSDHGWKKKWNPFRKKAPAKPKHPPLIDLY